MRTTLLLLAVFSFSFIRSQVDKEYLKKYRTFYSDEILLGQWKTTDRNDLFIERMSNGEYRATFTNEIHWFDIIRFSSNEFLMKKEGSKLYRIEMVSKDSLMLIDLKNRMSYKYARTDSKFKYRPGKEVNLGKSEKEHPRTFFMYYPAIYSPYALYAGVMNRKFNFYLGVRASNFMFYSGDLSYDTENGEIVNLSGESATDAGLSTEVSQSSFTIGLTSNLLKRRIYLHYGLGYGTYQSLRAYDIWELDSNQEWQFRESVWANEVEKEIDGIQAEAGIMFNYGVMISAGVGVLNFEKYDVQVGLGYAF